MAFDINNYKNSDLEYKTKIFFEDLGRYLSKENDMTANLANTAAFISAFFDNINWSGFYLLKENQLVLGPFLQQQELRLEKVYAEQLLKREKL